jgi:hypothetical protein
VERKAREALGFDHSIEAIQLLGMYMQLKREGF